MSYLIIKSLNKKIVSSPAYIVSDDSSQVTPNVV